MCSSSSKQSLPVYFKWKRLRFGFHGVCASLALCVTAAALSVLLWSSTTETNKSNTTRINLLVYASVLFNTITAFQARQLLDQVPLETEIVPGVVAPHREAFKRTMSMMHYANLRILGCMWLSSSNSIYKLFLAVFIYIHFVPRGATLDNGNTWIFVIPMCIGTTVDFCQYVFLPNGLASVVHYLLIEWCSLVIAFFFTLAFRGYFTVFIIYIVSALVVATLFGGGLYVIASSIVMDGGK